MAHLEHKIGDDLAHIRVTRALTVSVDRSLHVCGPGPDGHERVGHSQSTVIMGMDADRQIDDSSYVLSYLIDLMR